METSKEKKEMISKRRKIKIAIIIIICIILAIMGAVVIKNIVEVKPNEENNYEERNITEGTTLFEGVGHYGVAVAGNNNADRETSRLIKSYPQNWEEIKENIPQDILSKVNNISGSRLDFDGTIKAAWLTSMFFNGDRFGGDILVIKPDGSYQVLHQNHSEIIPLDITDSGWYYVSFLNSSVKPHQAWAITTIYENYKKTFKYINFIYPFSFISGSNNPNFVEIYYNNKFNLSNKFELFGVFISGGYNAWPIPGRTEDKVEAILSDGTYKQLYEDTYNGNTIFEGRSNTDFVNGTFNTIRNHNLKGGELDIFYEELGKDYFDGKNMIGYKVTKIGSDSIRLQLIGLSQEIYYPHILIKTENTTDNIVENENLHVKVNITNNATEEESTGYNTKVTCKIDEVLSDIKNIVVKTDGEETGIKATYDSITNEIVIDEIDKILPGQDVTIEFDTKVNSNIQNKGEVNSNIEIPIVVNVKSYPLDINSLEEAEKEKYENLYIEEEDTVNVTGIYKVKSGGVESKYIDEVTGEEIEIIENKNGLIGDEYETEAKEVEGYELVEIPSNATGEMAVEKITVTYKYRKLSKVIAKYIDVNNNKEIERIEKEYKEGEIYTTESKEIEGYRLINSPENANGTVERENIEVEYEYKKISEGIEIKYIDEVTGEEIGEKEIKNGLEKESYETESKDIEGYELVETPSNATGKMTVEKITVTYKYRKLSKVTAKYIDVNSSEEIERVEKEYKEGESYKTEWKEIEGYRLVNSPENTNGIVKREDIEVIYEYKKLSGGVVVKHIDKDSGEVIEEEKIYGVIGEKYTTQKQKLEKYNYIEVVGNVDGELVEEEIEVIYYYEKKQAIVEIIYEDENGKEVYKEIMEGKVGDKYKVELKEIENYKIKEVPENIEGIYGIDEIIVRYKVERVPLKVIINIVDENGEVIEIIEKEGYVGDIEEIELPEIDGYYTEEKNMNIEYGKENNINITYKKVVDPDTSDINLKLYLVVFIVSITIIIKMYCNMIASK